MIDTDLIRQALLAARQPEMLDTPEKLALAAESWKNAAVLGIDTEFLRERTYRAALGLVQISDGKKAWLVDTVQLQRLPELRELFSNPDCLKVLHSASEDLEVLWNSIGAVPYPLIDTQVACALVGQPLQMSYHNMVKWMCAVEVDKEQTRSNWIRRPLTPEQLHYAATDVVFLPLIARKLQQDLHALNRQQWLEEEIQTMIDNSKQEPEPNRAYLRIAAGGFMNIRSLHVLKALANWREKIAIEKDSARGFIVPDAALVQIASNIIDTPDGLKGIKELHPKALNRYQDEILELVKTHKNSQDPIEQLLPIDRSHTKLVKSLRAAIESKASELGVDAAVLASRKQVESLLRSVLEGSDLPERFTGWRKAVITEALLNMVAANLND